MIEVFYANNTLENKLGMSIEESFSKYIQCLYFISNDVQKDKIKEILKEVVYK